MEGDEGGSFTSGDEFVECEDSGELGESTHEFVEF